MTTRRFLIPFLNRLYGNNSFSKYHFVQTYIMTVELFKCFEQRTPHSFEFKSDSRAKNILNAPERYQTQHKHNTTNVRHFAIPIILVETHCRVFIFSILGI